jgi:hypothetical protein
MINVRNKKKSQKQNKKYAKVNLHAVSLVLGAECICGVGREGVEMPIEKLDK